MSADPVEINLGAEYDEELRAAVLGAFSDLGAALTDKLSGLDVSIFEAEVDGRTITVTAETYLGVTLSGERATVERLAQLIQARLSQRKQRA